MSEALAPVAPGLIDPASVHRTVLANGLTVLVREDHSAPVAAIVTYVKAGYFDETDDVVGIAHVLEHMYFKGTPTRGVGEIAKQTKAAGGYLNASTIYDHTRYYAVVPSAGFAAGLEIQADAYAASRIDADELAKELEVIIQEAKRKSDNASAVANETLFELLHDAHRMRRWRIGREPGLRALRQSDLLDFYRNFYRPSNTVLAIVGDVDREVALREVTRLYGALTDAPVMRVPGPAEPERAPGFRYRELTGDVGQTQIAFGWRTPGTLHADTPALDLLGVVLGTGRASRLYRSVRERRLASSVSAYDYTPTELGVFVVHAEATHATAPEAAAAMWAELGRLRRDGVRPEELERARRIFEARAIRRLEDMEGQANHLAEWEAQGDWRLGDRYLERLRALTPEEVTEAARRWLEPDRAALVVYRPEAGAPMAPTAEAIRARLDGEPLGSPMPYVAPSLIAAPAIGSAVPREREESGVSVFRTAGGIPILVQRKPGALAHLGIWWRGGAGDDPEELAGRTMLGARAALKGTRTRTAEQLAESAELLGGSLSSGVGGESVGWSISVPMRHVAAAMTLLADVAQEPVFPEDAVATERALAIADLAELRDDMHRWPLRLATLAAFEGHRYGVPTTGTEQSLARLDAAALRAWHRTAVLEGEAVVGIVGDAEPGVLAALAHRALPALRHVSHAPTARAVWPARLVQRVETREKSQTALALLFPGPARDDSARFAAMLTAGIASGLGGRFFDELRDRQSLAYTVQAFASDRPLAGTFGAYIATSPEREDAAREGLLGEFAKFRERAPTRDELDRAATYAIGTHAIGQQSGGAVLGEMVDAWLFGALDELRRWEAQVRAVRPEDVRALAERYFDPACRVEGVVRGTGRSV